MLKRILIVVIVFFIVYQIDAQSTTIWIVRHAEKDTSAAQKRDPALTELGKQRALDLADFLKGEEPDLVFATNTKRTKQTAAHFSAKLYTYDPTLLAALGQRIKDFQLGKKILIIGHSNTVLETIEALGGNRPIAVLTDDDYDYIFKLSLSKEGNTVTNMFHYGAMHHAKVK